MRKIFFLFLLCVAQIAGAQTISDKLVEVNDAKLNIRAAIASKSVDMTGVPFVDYHLSIASITSGGGDAEGTALAADVLIGKTFSNDTDIGISGTMPDNGAVTIMPTTATQTIPLGYHNGSGEVGAIVVDNLYDYNVASGVEILGVTGTLSPIAGINNTKMIEVELAEAGIVGDLFGANGGYFPSAASKTADVDTAPASASWGVAMSSDGQYLASADVNSPYLTTYRWNSDNNRYEKTAAQDSNPAGQGNGAAMSSDGQYLAVAHTTSPYLTTYRWSSVNNRYEKTAAQDVNPAGISWGAAMSSDGQYLAVAHTTSPYLTTYRWNSGNNRYEKTTAQDANPAGISYGAAMSSDGQYLAVAHTTSPYLTTYRWNSGNNRYEKTAAQDANPAGIGLSAALSSDGQYLAVAHITSPYLTTYRWNSDNNRYEKTTAQDVNPTNTGRGAALSSDGQYLAVAHTTSPYLTTYRWNSGNNRYEKTAAQDVNPAGNGRSVALSSGGQYIAVGHESSPYLTTYAVEWSENLSPAFKMAVGPINFSDLIYIGALLEDGSASDTVNFSAIWWRQYPLPAL